MKMAVEIARDKNIPFTFADREIQVTLRRAWVKSNFWNKMKLIASLLGSAFTKEELDEVELENLKKKSALEDMLEELSKMLPSIKEVLIDERDRYLATKIYETEEDNVVAVIGAGTCSRYRSVAEETGSRRGRNRPVRNRVDSAEKVGWERSSAG